MSYSVGRIPGEVRIDPDASGQERQQRRERPRKKPGDSVSISEEARSRSARQEGELEREAGD